MSYTITGKLYTNLPPKTVGKFTKNEFVIEISKTFKDKEYFDHVIFEASEVVTKGLKEVGTGSELDITFDVRGRKWTNKDGVVMYFNSLYAWKVEVKDLEEEDPISKAFDSPEDNFEPISDEDELPF